jgi:mevalonate pyrophosphate decarboxylase
MNEQVYYDTLDEMGKQVFDIAKDHLGTSFHVTKSNGYASAASASASASASAVSVAVVEPVMVKKKIRVKKVIKVKPPD